MLAESVHTVKITERSSTDSHTSEPASVAAGIERAIQHGNFRDALARCAHAYGPALGRLCMAFVGSQAEAEELVQETLLAAHDAFPQFRGEGTIRAFLFGIARKICARAVERRVRRDARLRLVQEEPSQADASELLTARRRASKAREALASLKPTEREALLLRYEADLSFREIAEACGCDEAAARKRVSRAILRLREILQELEPSLPTRTVAIQTNPGVASSPVLRRGIPLFIALMLPSSCSPPNPIAPTPISSATTPAVPSAAASTPTPPPRVFDYPTTRKESIAEEIHGTRVKDPYRWLEDEKSPEVRAWMDTQNQFAHKILDKLPERNAIANRLKELLYIDSMGVPYRYKNRYFFFRTLADKEKAIVVWKEGKTGKEKVLLDPNTWTKDGSESLGHWSVSQDGKRVAFTIKKNNSDEATMHVLDVATGKRSEIDVIEGAKYAYASWTPQGDGFYYARLPVDPKIPTTERPGYTELRFHKIGEDPAKDTLIHEKTGDPKTFLGGNLSKDGRFLWVTIQHGWNATDIYFRDLREPKQKEKWTPLTVGKDSIYTAIAYKGFFYIHTNEGAPKYRVFKVDPAKPSRENWKEIIPERKDATLDDLSLVGGKLSLRYLKDVVSYLELHHLDGTLDRTIPLPAPGSSTVLLGDQDQDDAYFSFNSLIHPREIYEILVKKGDPHLFFKAKIPVDPSLFSVEQRFATSPDGTPIPLFIVSKKGTKQDGSSPTLLYGYGGFQVAMQPTFRSSIFPWIERGGTFVLSVLRGGSEYGEEWHRNGMLHKKQNVFDDFIASAEFLIREKYTRPGRLAIQGASNGGLLVGAAMTQRPELFRVALCGVPLLDMVRYHLFGSGKTWIGEYGSSENADDFKVLYSYSPYHHVRPETQYPALLMLSADSDDRVDPMHARKFIAQIQENSVGGLALLRIEKNAGHGGADMLQATVQKSADELAFALSQMEP